jgi:hypothetical protein
MKICQAEWLQIVDSERVLISSVISFSPTENLTLGKAVVGYLSTACPKRRKRIVIKASW